MGAIRPLASVVEARVQLAAAAAIRRAALMVAATLFGVGAILFLSISAFFALLPGVGAAGAALILALIWGLLAALLFVLAQLRPRRPRAGMVAPPAVAAPSVPPAAAVGVPPPPSASLATRISRAAPILAIGALLAGIIAGRR